MVNLNSRWLFFNVRYSRLYQIHHKKHETLTTLPPILIYIKKFNSKLVFKIKDEYKLELQTFETMELSGSRKKDDRQNIK